MRAKYFESLPDKAVRCVLCPQFCEIADGGRGICGMRVNEKGTLTALGYGHAAAFAMDPIEKKPLYHWHPGSAILSTGGYGCNLTCSFCQNWHLSRNNSIGESVTPSGLVSMAIAEGSTAIAYTYNEPLVNFEFLLDCAKAARIAGLANVIVSNGFINSPPLSELQPFLDAANIDLKGSDEFYKKLCTGRATPVKEAIVGLHKAGIHVEVTYLVIPTQNDSDDDIAQTAKWISSEVDPSIPLHFSAYFPSYRAKYPPTPFRTLEKARLLALEYLKYVYVGNCPPGDWNDTMCPGCRSTLVSRRGYSVDMSGIANGHCAKCGHSCEFLHLQASRQ